MIKIKTNNYNNNKKIAYDKDLPSIIISGKSCTASVEATAPAPLTKVHEARFSWSLFTAKAVKPYFSQPYQDSDLNDAYLCLKVSDREVVYRPNHSLAHGLRQAYLAVNLGLMFKHAKEELLGPKAQKLCLWVKKRFKDDPKFLEKVLFTNAFQRTGRQSELSSKENRAAYERYLCSDQKNFETKIQELDLVGEGKLFKDQKETDVYKEALVRKFDEESDEKNTGLLDEDVVFLSRLFYTGHLLDLRRIPHFSKEKILKDVSMQLFGTETPNTVEQEMLLKAWRGSGDYLKATGDRDMEDSSRRDWDKAVFYAQAQNPELLIEALELAMTKPEEKLLSSLLAHIQRMRELKTTVKKYDGKEKVSEPQTEHQKKIEDFRKNLKNAPYTASEAYLKIILNQRYGTSYIEIPIDCSEENARKITDKNVRSFLSKEEAADEEYVTILVDAMMEERKQRDKVVLYHTTEAELGIFYDIYSQLRNQLAIQGGIKAMTILRAIDEAFAEFNKSISPQKEKANASDFAEKFKSIKDTDSTYQAMGLSTNSGLFGSTGENQSDTCNMFYNMTKDKVTLHPPLYYDKFIAYIEQKTGIFGICDLYKEILDNFVKPQDVQLKKTKYNRKLIQIFVDPEALEEATYFSVIFGHPVTKGGKAEPLQNVIELLRNNPEKLEEYLSTLSAEERKRLMLHDLQARLFMRPDLMLDASCLIQIKSYWRLPLKNEEAYYLKIRAGVNESLLSWLKNGCPLDSDTFLPETLKLPRFMEMVYQGATTSQPPKATPFTPEERLVKLLISKKNKHAAILLEESYEELKDKTFISPGNEYGHGKGQFDLAGLIMNNNPSIEVIEVAFKKNIFKGGDFVYEFLCKLVGSESRYVSESLLKTLHACSDPIETVRLFTIYIERIIKNGSIVDALKGINYIENNEEYLKAFLPFFEKCTYGCYSIKELCKSFSKIPSLYKNINLFEDALKIFAFNYLLNEQHYFTKNIGSILEKINFYREIFSSQECDRLFLTASKMIDLDSPKEEGSAKLEDKFKFIDILSKIKWVPDDREEYRPISAPFNAQSILWHAKRCPNRLNMKFLESPVGLAVIDAVIGKLNAREVPSGNVFCGYDRYSPGSDYNRCRIAQYASSCGRY